MKNPEIVLNVNFPIAEFNGVKVTRLGKRVYSEGVIERLDPRGRKYYWIGGDPPTWRPGEGTDFEAVQGTPWETWVILVPESRLREILEEVPQVRLLAIHAPAEYLIAGPAGACAQALARARKTVSLSTTMQPQSKAVSTAMEHNP